MNSTTPYAAQLHTHPLICTDPELLIPSYKTRFDKSFLFFSRGKTLFSRVHNVNRLCFMGTVISVTTTQIVTWK